MLAFLTILPLLHIHLADLDGQAAQERAEQMLHQLGFREKLSLKGLTNSDWSSKEPSWTVEFSTPKGPIDLALNAHTGNANRLNIPYLVQAVSGQNKPPTAADEAKVRKILAILGSVGPLDRDNSVGWAGPFHVLTHGHPFFNLNPCYGPSLSDDPATGLPSIYYASPPIPPVNASEPKIAASFALAQLRDWGHARALQRGLPAVVDPSAGDLEPELGYWKPSGSDKGLLVWRATKYTQIQGKKYGMGALRMFVDALTGEFIEPDDPAWGANP